MTRLIDGEDADDIRVVADLLRAVPALFIFTNEDFVVHLLEQAYDADDECYDHVSHVLQDAVRSRSRNRIIGDVDHMDVALHQQATKMVTKYAHSWPVRQFYEDIVQDADESMRQAHKEDEAYEDDG